MLLRLLCAVLMIGAFAGPAQAANLFTEDFESSVAALQAKYACSSTPPRSPFTDGDAQDWDTAQKFAGTYAMKQNYTGSQYDNPPKGGGHCEYDFVDQTQRDIWITWYHFLGTNWQSAGGGGVGGVATKGLYMYMRSPSTGQVNGWVFHYFDGTNQLSMSAQGIKDHKGPNGPGSGTVIPYDTENMRQNVSLWNQPEGQWVCYEANFKLNTPGVADGQYLLYSTNMSAGGGAVLRASHTNREFIDANTSGRMPSDARWFRFKYYRQDGSGDMWYDNSYVDTTRRGCSGTTPPSDTTPPGQVTDLAAASNTDTSITYTWTASSATDLQSYIIRGCTPGACTNFATVGTVPAGTTTFTWNGLLPSTLHRVQVAAQDSSGNVGTASSIVDDTTDASSVLPGVTGFTASATGGTITYTGTPTDFRIEFGGDFAGSTSIIRTLAQVPGGVLSFVWPAGTNWACIRARNAVPTEGPVYRCNQVQASTGGVLRQHPTNGRWFTDDSGKALLLTGPSGKLTFPNATRSALQNLNTTAPTDYFARADSADLGASWSAGYSAGTTFKIVDDGVECSVLTSNACLEMHSAARANNQAAEVLIRSWTHSTTFAVGGVVLRMAAAPTNTYYYFLAQETPSGYSTQIEKYVAGVQTVLTSSTAFGWGPGDILRATANGTTLTLYRNGVPILTTTDASIASGSAGLFIYNAGSATSDIVLDEFQAWDLSSTDPSINDYVTAFDTLVTKGLNYARMWLYPDTVDWGEAAWYAAGGQPRVPSEMMPWVRTGVSTNCTSGTCVLIGKYNLESFNEAFFTQIRQRVLAARSRGLKLSIALFEGWGTSQVTYHAFSSPFSSGNNEQGISCDTNANGRCEELHTLAIPNVTIIQDAYVKKLIDTLYDLDNIMWEIVNEPNNTGTLAWQDHIAETIAAYELTKGVSHLIIQSPYINPAATSNAYLRSNSRFDVVVPSCLATEDYSDDPPVADGNQIEMIDSDHTGVGDMCGTETTGWPWRTFLRGRHTISLGERETAPVLAQIEEEQGQTIAYANRVNLAAMTPQGDTSIVSTAFGLVNACSEYLMYMPSDGSSTIDLTACGGTYDVEYLNVTSSAVSSGGTTTGGAVRSFNPAGSDPMVVYLKLNSVTDTTAPVISGGQPNGAQASGTTSVTVTVITDKASTCKMDSDPDIAYGSQDTTFSSTGALLHTQSVGSLSDGNSYARFVKCSGTASGVASADYPVAWSVLSAAPALPPDNVASLTGSLNEAAGTIFWQWPAVSGAVSYLLEISEGGEFLTAVETASATTNYVQSSLTVGSYTARIKAVDGGNVQSVGWTTSVAVNTTLPPQMTGLTETAPGTYSNTVILSWAAPTNSNLVSAIERCTGAACTTFAYHGGGNTTGYTDTSVSPGTTYCYRGKFSNPVFGGTSANWSSTYCATTKTIVATGDGLIRPRTPLPFGVSRLPRN